MNVMTWPERKVISALIAQVSHWMKVKGDRDKCEGEWGMEKGRTGADEDGQERV